MSCRSEPSKADSLSEYGLRQNKNCRHKNVKTDQVVMDPVSFGSMGLLRSGSTRRRSVSAREIPPGDRGFVWYKWNSSWPAMRNAPPATGETGGSKSTADARAAATAESCL